MSEETTNKDVLQHLNSIKDQKAILQIEEQLALQKALTSDSAEAIFKAKTYLQNIEKRQPSQAKSVLIDPNDVFGNNGYKDKSYSISYNVLRNMAKTHVIKAIIETRKEQVSSFCQPQADKYGAGFIVQKKSKFALSNSDTQEAITKTEQRRIQRVIEFILNCGTSDQKWHADSFDDFIRKIVHDSLVFDQATFEIVRNRGGEIAEFFATDGTTYRIADSYDDDDYKFKEKVIKGHTPSYVQVLDSRIISEFYPWELGFGIRNPSTDIMANGYGKSELEDMIGIVTSILNSDKYNSNFFRVGSHPSGIIKYKGMMNANTVEDFKKQWQSQMGGVDNHHKIPALNADEIDFIPTGATNRDMEFSKYQEFLIKISCALYKIDPSEIGFPMNGSVNNSGLGGEGGVEARLEYSQDKGLKPLLKKIEKWINKWLVEPFDNQYEFRFVGINGEADFQTELDSDIKQMQNFVTMNEIRKKRNLPPIENGDVPMNSAYLQVLQMKSQEAQMAQQQQGMMGGGEMGGGQDGSGDPYADNYGQDDGNVFGGQSKNPFIGESDEEGQGAESENPFLKSLEKDWERIFS